MIWFPIENLLPLYTKVEPWLEKHKHAIKKVAAATLGVLVAAPLLLTPLAPISGGVAAATAQATDNALEGRSTTQNVGIAAAEGAVVTAVAGGIALPLAPFAPDAAKAIENGAKKVVDTIEHLPPDWPKWALANAGAAQSSQKTDAPKSAVPAPKSAGITKSLDF